MTDTTPIEQFKRDGYLAIESAFNADEVDRMRREADAVLELIIGAARPVTLVFERPASGS